MGRYVDLPHGAEPPFRIFLNGVEQEAGRDCELVDHSIVFSYSIWKEQSVRTYDLQIE